MSRYFLIRHGQQGKIGAPQFRHGLGTVILGVATIGVALAAPTLALYVAAVFLLVSGILELLQAYSGPQRTRRSRFLGGGLFVVAGILLFSWPEVIVSALALLLGGLFVLYGAIRMVPVVKERAVRENPLELLAGGGSILIGILIALQWPLSGIQSIGIGIGFGILVAGLSILASPPEEAAKTEPEAPVHPDSRLGLPPHPEIARLVSAVQQEEVARRPFDRYWELVFVATFFAIHVGRMDPERSLVGLVSPFVATVGDVFYALLLGLAVATPLHLAWRMGTRRLERRAWRQRLDRLTSGQELRPRQRLTGHWLKGRIRFALRVNRAYSSPSAAICRGLWAGLPWAAVLIATNPIWGLSWHFNTENWATGVWEKWTEYKVDDWREQMVRAVRARYDGLDESELFRITPELDSATGDFSFIVIGDPGEGDASQESLRDQFLALGRRPDIKFLMIASDVIYPQGAMKDYENHFYLPFKGFDKPIYAIPGNHDWYDALEAFTANFFEPEAARAALQARETADDRLTLSRQGRIEEVIGEAAWLRGQYGLRTAGQRSPYFELQTEHFALITVDTGILRTFDDDQLNWLRGALERARGKFTMVIPGHPFFAAGHRIEGNARFAALHRLLEQYGVDIVMAGDTHDLEYYRQPYRLGRQIRTMHHFVNGGGGAYLSIGTSLDWPEQPAVRDCAFYPRTEAVVAKLDEQTPAWKLPIWFWVKHLDAWPMTSEFMAGAFDFNTAPFFQSFVEVRVEPSANRVRIIPYGVDGPLTWGDLYLCNEEMIPSGFVPHEPVAFTFPMGVRSPE